MSIPNSKKNCVIAADDAASAEWFTMQQIKELKEQKKLAGDVPEIIKKFDALRLAGF